MSARFALFVDRRDAGRKLAAALTKYRNTDAIVLALPRGGVPVAYQVAVTLGLPMDMMLVRKIGAPLHPELGIGAVVDGEQLQVVLNDDIVRAAGAGPEYIAAATARERAELERRRRTYRGDRPPPHLAGRTVILVDDGIATGGTVRAVLKALARAEPRARILAAPVAPPDTLATLRGEADEIVCLATPAPFYAVGLYYRDFTQTSDDEVIALLNAARLREAAPPARRPAPGP